MKKIIHTNELELWPIKTMLNLVHYGFGIQNFIDEVGFTDDELLALIKKISQNQVSWRNLEHKIIITFNDREIEILKRAFEEVFKRIKEEELQSRIGISIQKAYQLKDKFIKSSILSNFFRTVLDRIKTRKASKKFFFGKPKIPYHLTWLMNWYNNQCDGDWEHGNGITIIATNKPGWHLKINLWETELQDKPFSKIIINRTDTDWIQCFIENKTFEGIGGPLNLPEIFQVFHTWAISNQ